MKIKLKEETDFYLSSITANLLRTDYISIVWFLCFMAGRLPYDVPLCIFWFRDMRKIHSQFYVCLPRPSAHIAVMYKRHATQNRYLETTTQN